MLNCGIVLPASTGSDWFLCSNNRVYVDTGKEFSYDSWLTNLQSGKSFITNGPALTLSVNDRGPGSELELSAGDTVEVTVSWHSHYPLNKIEIVQDGRVAAEESYPEGTVRGDMKKRLTAPGNSWIAARCGSEARDTASSTPSTFTPARYMSEREK